MNSCAHMETTVTAVLNSVRSDGENELMLLYAQVLIYPKVKVEVKKVLV